MEVTVISSSPSKRDEALNRLKADKFLVSTNEEEMKAAEASMPCRNREGDTLPDLMYLG